MRRLSLLDPRVSPPTTTEQPSTTSFTAGGASTAESSSSAMSAHLPQVTMPKGGGAIRGMGEKFTVNAATGTGSMVIPIATSPGRGGVSPQLSLSYDSGSGNGIFGFGWSPAIPSIARKTDK